jgi:hypothetical protein
MGSVPFTNTVGAPIGRCVGFGCREVWGGFVLAGEAWLWSCNRAIISSLRRAPFDLGESMVMMRGIVG